MALKNCFLKSLNFKINKFTSDGKYSINPRLKSEVKVPQNANGDVIITLTLDINNMEKPTPFNLKVVVDGIFDPEMFENDRAEASTRGTSDLFLYVRGIVATVTANANIPSYLLPIIDFNKTKGEEQPIEGN